MVGACPNRNGRVSSKERLDAMRVCAKLQIPFITLDLEKEYKRDVVDYMIAEYKAGPDAESGRDVQQIH